MTKIYLKKEGGECPHCKKWIEYLECRRREVVVYEVGLGIASNILSWEEDDRENDDEGLPVFSCNECGRDVCKGEDKAVKFLQGKGARK